ncbi:glycosyltransferase family 4 protein [Vulcanisaeta thermophila]|uniref:glycosyltransferase family 4 protein n=1 Tax=Vulcanisaeta thermophila TaxID=867917 RepID=UPI000852D7DB|nr:glycosyltransferase [Vulcanisaeta thermophila]
MDKLILSILHHSIPPIRPGTIAEEDNAGWHFRSAKALRKYGGYQVIAIRPSGSEEAITKIVDGIPIILTPTIDLSPSKRLWKWSEYSPNMTRITEYLVKKYNAVPYIHEYRALNSEQIIRKLLDRPMILQHHGSTPPSPRDAINPNPINTTKALSKLRREKILTKVKGAIFVLNRAEKEYLEKLGTDAEVIIRTMGVDFNELKPPTEDEVIKTRRELGIPEGNIVMGTYVGVFREEFSTLKGANYIVKIWSEVRKAVKNITLIVTGLNRKTAETLRAKGIMAYEFLPHNEYIKLVKAMDVYFLPATPGYYGGIGVAVMEALALGKPVVSPTLMDMPNPREIKYVGIATPYVTENNLKAFINALINVVENTSQYKPSIIREIAHKYYSWESFVKTFNQVISNL